MKLKLLISRSGVEFSQVAGEIIEVDDVEALRMIAAGQADAVAQVEPETANTKAPIQKRVKS